MKDSIYSQPKDPLVKFTFDKQVADVFPDMIERSVPGYATTIAMIGVLAAQYAHDGSNCYDLGSSLGAATLAMRHHIRHDVNHATIPVQLICDDILNVEISSASVVVLNFTLQFLEPAQRDNMIKLIYSGLLPDGILILSEKVSVADDLSQQLQTNWHHSFKKANGYSDLEVAQKRTALEKVLIPETEQKNTERLKETGFKSVQKWFQCFNFISFVAQK